MSAPLPRRYKKIRLLQLAAVIFLTVSGGPYGLEPLLAYAGKHAALLFLVVTPMLWDVPVILTVCELNSMMPVNGGYYQWVKKAMGLRWAFFEGWWTWLYTFTDLAIYPVLFVQYASFFFPQIAPYKIPVCLGIIWLAAFINIRGIVSVGKISLILSAGVLLPFCILFGLAFSQHSIAAVIPPLSLKGLGFSSASMALYTVMWNYIGWDNVSTYAEEVDKPVRTYLFSTMIAFVCIFVLYLLAIYTAQQSPIDAQLFSEQGFPLLGVLVGGHWLGVLIAAGGMASALGIFSAVLLSVSRVPKVMADDRLLPGGLHALHPRYQTPYISILVCSVAVSGMVLWTFSDLIVIDVTLYGAGLILEFISLIALRIKAPEMKRPFAIPLSTYGLAAMFLLPVGVFGVALSGVLTSNSKMLGPLLFSIVAILSAEVIWRVIQWFHSNPVKNIEKRRSRDQRL